MSRLRVVKLDPKSVEVNKPYLLMAVAVETPLKPGEVPEVGKPRPVQMNMMPCQLEWYDEDTGEIEPVEIELPPRIMVPR